MVPADFASSRQLARPSAILFVLLATFLLATPSHAQLSPLGGASPIVMPGSEFGGGVVRGTDSAYDPGNGVYLVVAAYGPLRGIFVNADGTPVSGSFQISPTSWAHFPRVTYSADLANGTGGTGAFLVTWHDTPAGSNANTVHTRVVSRTAGGPIGGTLLLSDLGTFWEAGPAVAYSPSGRVFLVVWQTCCGGNSTIRGRRVGIDGNGNIFAAGAAFGISTGPGRDPGVAFNAASTHFGVSFSGWDNQSATVSLARVTTEGALVAAPAVFARSSATYVSDIEVNPVTGRYIAMWSEGPGARAAEIDTAGTVLGIGTIATQVGTYDSGDITYNPSSGTFLLVGHHASIGEVGAAELSSRGARIGNQMTASSSGGVSAFYPRSSSNGSRWLDTFARAFDSVRVHGVLTGTTNGGGDVPLGGGGGNPTPPSITTQPQSQTVTSGAQVTLTVGATGTSPFTYQWYIGNSGDTASPIQGATSSSLNAWPTVTTNYWVRVSNSAGAANSNTATVTVTGVTNQAPAITSQPQSQSSTAGALVTLSVTATGSQPLTYQWYLGSTPNTASPIQGATSNTLSAWPTVTTSYWVRVTNSAGIANSNTATVTIAGGGSFITNGDFSDGLNGWLTYATPDMSYISAHAFNSMLEFYRFVPPAGTSNQATVFQVTGRSAAGGAGLKAQFDLGNSSNVRKRLSVLLLDSDFSDLALCSFWLEPDAPLARYQMRAAPGQGWSNVAIYFYAASAGAEGGNYQVDNVSLEPDATQPATRTDCIDPWTPNPPSGGTSGNLVNNGNFQTGNLQGWTSFGSIVSQVAGGVAEFYQPAGQTAGTLMQATGVAVPSRQIITANFRLGNSSGVRKRVTILLHDANFSDLAVCSFYLSPGMPLSQFSMRTYATKAWANTTISFYDATPGVNTWTRIDDVSVQQTPGTWIGGTECLAPGSAPSFSGDAPASASHGFTPSSSPIAASRGTPVSGTSEGPVAGGVQGDTWNLLTAGAAQAAYWVKTFDLRGVDRATLRFESWLPAADGDAVIEMSLDGEDWKEAGRVHVTDAWQPMEIDLSAWADHVVYVRFVLRGRDGVSAHDATWRVAALQVIR